MAQQLVFITLFVGLTKQGGEAVELYVSQGGSDSPPNTCQDPTTPCHTIQYALRQADSDDTILIEGGGETPGQQYNITGLTLDKSVTLSSWKARPLLQCHKPTQTCQVLSANIKITFGDIIVDSCWLCLNNSDFRSQATMYTRVKITIDVEKDSSIALNGVTALNTEIMLGNGCDPRGSQSCPLSSLSLEMMHTVLHGEDSVLSTTGNITSLDVQLTNVRFESMGHGVTLSNFDQLNLNGRDVTIQDMRSLAYGFTIHGGPKSKIDIRWLNLSVLNNSCYDGGALHIHTKRPHSVQVSIDQSEFTDNVGELAGAALKLDLHPLSPNQTVILDNSIFDSNHNSESAAGIFLTGGSLEVTNTTFTNNHVTTIASRLGSTPQRKGAGGAINFFTTSTLIMDKCTFINNTANWFGGSISGAGNVTIANTYFENSDRDVHSNIGDMMFLMGPAVFDNITCVVNTTKPNLAMFWYSSQLQLTSQGEGYLNFLCPIGSQFRNESLPEYVNGTLYAFKDLFYYCDPCPDGQYSLQRGYRNGPMEFDKGNWSSDFQCNKCVFGAECKLGTIQSRINFWGYAQGSPAEVSLLSCPDGYCCDQEVCPSYNTCAEDRTGTLCGECREGMSEILFSTDCRPNEECHDSWYMAVDVLLSIVGLLFFLYQIEIAIWIMKYLFWQEVTSNDDPSMAGYIKTIFYFYQTIDLLNVQDNAAEKQIGMVVQPFLSYLLTFRPLTAVFGVCPFPGLNPVTKNLLTTTQTIYMFVMLGILFLVRKAWEKHRARLAFSNGGGYCSVPEDLEEEEGVPSSQHVHSTEFRARLAATCVSMFQYNYITMANVFFILLACVPVDNVYVLYYDGNVQCLQPWQYIIILINIIHVIPFFIVVIVSRHLLENNRITIVVFFVSYFLPLPMLLYWLFQWMLCKYREKRDNIDMGREDSLLAVNGSEADHSNSVIKDQILFVVEEPFINRADEASSARYWEGILVFRRLVLALMAAFIMDTLLALTLQTITSLIFLLWHLHVKPFGSKSANNFETASLTTLTIIAICHLIQATFFSAGKLPDGPSKMQIYVTDWIELVLINIFPIILVTSLVFAIVVRLGYLVYQFLFWLIKKCR